MRDHVSGNVRGVVSSGLWWAIEKGVVRGVGFPKYTGVQVCLRELC